MGKRRKWQSVLLVTLLASAAGCALAMPYLQDDNARRPMPQPIRQEDSAVAAQPLVVEEDTIPDSLLNARWRIQPTIPLTQDDLDRIPADLRTPDNIQYNVDYNDTIGGYLLGTKMGGTWLSTPVLMSPEEYAQWVERRQRSTYFRQQNQERYEAKGKEKFDFSDMHFDLGPAEKIFGPGGVRIRTQGTAEIRLGATLKNIDNPSLPIRNRKTTTMDFDEKVNLNVSGKVGDKVNLGLNYNTDATFDFDAQNLKLKYEGKEDEIIKLVEAGNVSFPSNSSLISGASSLFGIRTDMQFGKLSLQLVGSQKLSNSKSVSTKGGAQTTSFDIDASDYEDNRHFFLSHYFRGKYDEAMSKLPNLTTGITINRVEIWVTNKTGTTSNSRDIVALTDLGEVANISNPMWSASGMVPSNAGNTEYTTLNALGTGVRDIEQVGSTLEGMGLTGGVDFEKLESARLLTSSEYTLNSALGYVSLRTSLQTDQVLAIAYEYTYGGVTYQVGEFASDNTDATQALLVKSLKNTNNHPSQGNWDLMMKNVYHLGSSIEKERFRLDIKLQSDTTGVYLTYIPEAAVKDQTLIKIMGADRLDNNNNAHSNGYYDYVEGYTVSDGRVFIPKVEPFGSYLYQYLLSKGLSADKASSYAFTELYDSTKTQAKQIAEKDKYRLMGQFRGSSENVISLGAYNVPQGSVVVTAGGMTLTEGTDYTVDYNAGEVTILNQSIIDAGTAINVSCESNTDYGQMRKTMFGLNWAYDFSSDFQLSGTIQHLSEQSLTTKVNLGSEPVNNTLWGINVNWKKESQWLTNMLDKIPFLHVTQPSHISFTGEFAQLIAGQAGGIQDNASYIDDFENTKNTIDVSTPTSWFISSVPSMFPESSDNTGLTSGFNRSRLAWYYIDPLFTRRGSSLTPSHIKSDLDQLSNHYVREVYVRELFPNRDQSTYSGATNTLSVLNLAYYPSERGPYNFDTNLNMDGTLPNPERRWGGMMRKLDNSDFEAANVEYIEFWLLDPFFYTNQQADAADYGGDLYFNLGEVSEDILRDGKKFYESGMPVDGSQNFITTQWGRVPRQSTVTYAFATTEGSRALQDVGFNGLNDEQERDFYFNDYLSHIQGKVNQAVYDSIYADPANDNYHYFRGTDWDELQTPILQRYKYINNPQGNSPDSDSRTESYDTSYKSTPDVEDINQDYTLNEYERYYQYRVSIRPEDMVVGRNFIVDKREYTPTLRNGTNDETVTWYQFRVPVDQFESKVGNVSDFNSIRFMRMFLTGFKKPIVLRFGTLDLVRGEWRTYDHPLGTGGNGTLETSAVNIEENSEKTPVNYVLPPGITREQDPTQPQLVEANEQSLSLVVKNLSNGEAKAVYRNTSLDLRQYRRLQMFTHLNALAQDATQLSDNQLSVFIRLGSDNRSNYYEYEIPLKLTPPGTGYNRSSATVVWPEENMLDIYLSVFTNVKKLRNQSRAQGVASYTAPFSVYDTDHPNNKVSILGNPTLGEVKTMMIGVRNNAADLKSGEVWVNELRLLETDNSGGWAANANLNVQLSDFGTLNLQGKYMTEGFGGLEDGVMSRSQEDYGTYSFTTSLELGKFFPDKAKVSIPLYYSVTQEKTSPKYNPMDTDMLLDDALDAAANEHERDSIESIAVTKVKQTNFSISNARVGIATKRHPMPYDPANFSVSYSHSYQETTGQTTVYERETNWRAALDYNWTPVYKPWTPFKNIKSKSKWWEILKKFGLNWLPQNVAFNTEMTRNYYELQERDMEALENSELPLSFSQQFLWNRQFSIRWDLTSNLHMNFQSGTNAEIEEPYTPVNKDLYPDRYQAWKDSVWTSIRHFGTPLDYDQTFTLSYRSPLNLIPIFDWVSADANYVASYNWARGSELEDGTTLGNTIANNRNLNVNASFNMEKLYNHVPFLKATNDRFNREKGAAQIAREQREKEAQRKQRQEERRKLAEEERKIREEASSQGKDPDAAVKEWKAKRKEEDAKKNLPRNQRSFEKEIVLRPDTTLEVSHGKRTKRIRVTARTEDGKRYKLKFRKLDNNKIRITNKVDSATRLKITVTPKPLLDENRWYRLAQCAARVAMMVRNIQVSYTDQYQMTLPGFLPTIGDVFGQTKNSVLSPGLDFAFGLTDDGYVRKALEHDWLLLADTIATPATSTLTRDLQIRMTLEPVKNLKIDLNASRTETRQKTIQYMYEGMPTTQSGTFTMTTVSLGSAFEPMGDARSGYHSKTFEKFVRSLDGFRDRVEAQYRNATYPQGFPMAGGKFNPEHGTVDKYSGDVMIPAFLKAYTGMGGNSLELFPALSRLLPNWSVRYSGLGKLPWFRDVFKSVNITHAYKSVFAIGSYSSYSTYQEYMNGLGFITDASTGNPVPSTMYNISQVSINEAFSPLLGVDLTFHNNLTAKLEYRQTRVLTLSMTSVQINEATSKDWVVGLAYKINDLNLFGGRNHRRVRNNGRRQEGENATSANAVRVNSVNKDLNLRLDLSYRRQASIIRDIASLTSSASSGNTAFRLSFSADYTLSRMLTMSFYYDRQTNTPLLSSSSYPTTTQDFGLSIKFSLTR